MASSSSGRPASRSWSIDVLCSPTFSAPVSRCSIETGSSSPSFWATASVSVMISRIRGATSGSRAISPSVAPVSALIGLNATLPRSFTQISWRIRVVMGQRNPAWPSASARRRTRSEREPSGSPSEIRAPS